MFPYRRASTERDDHPKIEPFIPTPPPPRERLGNRPARAAHRGRRERGPPRERRPQSPTCTLRTPRPIIGRGRPVLRARLCETGASEVSRKS